MLVTRLKLKNWRNFRQVDIQLRERVYLIGPNASGKSNLLDALRFLRDIARPEGGGLQKAVHDRGGVPRIRCLMARKDPEIRIDAEFSAKVGQPAAWQYSLAFRSEGKGQQRPIVSMERVVELDTGQTHLDRPDDDDRADTERLTQTSLEQINANKAFRQIAELLSNITYLHLVPQLLKHADQFGPHRLENDPFGQAFLERIASLPERTRLARLKKINEALRVCVPNMKHLRLEKDEATGVPHLEAQYEHWRPHAGWQREDQFSDGTLRLLGIMWSLLDGDAPLLLEEPELSLNEDIVRQIHQLLLRTQRQSKYRRQIFLTTHSEALLEDRSIDPDEVLRLEPTADGTKVQPPSEEDVQLIHAGYSLADTVLPKTSPVGVEQLALFLK